MDDASRMGKQWLLPTSLTPNARALIRARTDVEARCLSFLATQYAALSVSACWVIVAFCGVYLRAQFL